jgi:Fe-S-cluster containining protein
MVEPLRRHELALRHDPAAKMRCVALAGVVGQATHCTIYAARPSPCRELGAAWEHGAPSPQCDRARAVHGLPPLTPESWSR